MATYRQILENAPTIRFHVQSTPTGHLGTFPKVSGRPIRDDRHAARERARVERERARAERTARLAAHARRIELALLVHGPAAIAADDTRPGHLPISDNEASMLADAIVSALSTGRGIADRGAIAPGT